MNKKRTISLLILLIIILNMFSPYTILFVNAATGTMESDSLVFHNCGVTTLSNGKRVIKLELALLTSQTVTGGDIQFEFDKSKVVICRPDTGATGTTNLVLNKAMMQTENKFSTVAGSMKYTNEPEDESGNKKTGIGRINYFWTFEDDINPIDQGYQYGSGEQDIDLPGQKDPDRGVIPLMYCYFTIVDDSIDENALPSDLFKLTSNGESLPTGARIPHLAADGVTPTSTDIYSINYGGFATAETPKTIVGISKKTDPTTTTYVHGDTIDLTGGKIDIEYDDTTHGEIDMTDSTVTFKTPSDHKADFNNPSAVLRYGGFELTIPLTVTDVLETLTYKGGLSAEKYEPGNDLTGATLEAVWKSGKKESLTGASTGVTMNSTVASIDTAKGFTKVSAEGELPVRGTQKIEFTYEGKKIETIITVNDTIAGITVKTQPNKKVYKSGESLDLTGAVVNVTLGSGGNTDINLPNGNIKVLGYNNTSYGSKQNLTVKFGETTITAPTTIDVEVYNYVTGANLTQPNNVTPTINTDLDLTGTELQLLWKTGNSTNVTDISKFAISGYDKTKKGSQKVTLTYNLEYTLSDGTTKIQDTITKDFTVTVMNPITGISISKPSKTTYYHGETFEFSDAVITVTYADTSKDTEPITSATIKETISGNTDKSKFTSPQVSEYTNDTLTKNITIEFSLTNEVGDNIEGSTNYDITITNYVEEIKMGTVPANINYNIGATTYDLSNTAGTDNTADIIVTYQAGNSKIVKLTESMLTPLNTLTSTAGDNKAVTVAYGTKQDKTPATTTFNINVKDSVLSIAVTEGKEPPAVLKVGEELDVTGGYITVTKANGSTQVAITRDMVKNFNKEQLGNQTLRIEYGQDVNGNPVWTTYPVVVKDYVESVTINPETVTGKYGESLSKIISDNNITYTVKYKKAGEQTAVALTTGMVAGYNENTTDAQNLTVTYTDTVKDLYPNCNTGTATLNITLKNTVKSIAITAPTKTKYNHGDTLDNPTIVVTYEDDTTKTVEDARNYIFEADGTTPAIMTPTSVTGTDYDTENYKWTKNFVIKYSEGEGVDKVEESVTYNNVTINNQVQDIEMFSSPTKQEYNINDNTWDLTGTEITVTRKAGPAYQINVEESMVPALNTLTTAQQEDKLVTVTYEGANTSFTIDVKNGVTGIVITAPTDNAGTKFEHGDTLTFGNGTIVVTYANGDTKPVSITSSMVKETLTGSEVNMSPTYEGEYKTNKKITKNLTIEYSEGGVSAEAKEYSITITNPIQNIAITEYPQNEFKVNEMVTNKGAKGKITITRKSNHTDEIAITGTMIKNDIDTSVEISNVKNYVVYQDPIETAERELEYTYNVTNGVQSVSIKVPDNESDLVFNYGDTITYKSGAINKVSLSNVPTSTPGFAGATIIDKNTGLAPTTALDYSKFDANNEAKITIQVSYIEPTNNALTDTKEYEITVKNNVNTLRIDPEPTDKTYNVNDATYKLEGGKLKIQRAVGPEKEVDLEDITFTPEGNTITDLTTLTTTANAGTTQTVTITYEGKPATFNINIVNGITGVTITKPSKAEYEHGENLSLEGNTVLHYADGTDNSANPIPLTLSMFSENGGAVNMSPDAGTYDQTTFEQEKTVQITYTDEDGKTYTPVNYTFKLKNVVDHLEYVTAPTGTYELGETIYYPIGTIKTVRKAKDESKPIDITSDMVTNLSTETATTEGKTAKITYAGKTLDYTYEVHDFVESVVITVPTNDEGIKFFHGDELNFGNGSITVNYKSSPGTPTPITGSMTGLTIKEVVNGTEQNVDMHNNTYGSDNKATKTIRLTYEKDGKTDSKDYTITITNDVTKIEIVEPTDRTYNIGDTSYKLAGGQVKVYRSNNSSAPAETITLPNNNFDITPELSTLTASDGNGKEVTLTYNGTDVKPGVTVSEKFTINVQDNSVQSMTVEGAETNYKVGDSFNYDKGNLVVTRKNGSVEKYPLTTAGMNVTGFDSSTEVTGQEITVSYTKGEETFTAKYNVNITNAITSISVNTPSKTEYFYGEDLELSGMEITVTDINSNVLPAKVPVTTNMISGYNKEPGASVTYPQTQQVTVTYGKKADGSNATATFNITLKDHITGIQVVNAKEDYEYEEAGSLDLSKGQVQVIMASGTPATPINLNDTKVKVDTENKFNSKLVDTQTITVQYGVDKENNPLTTTYNVTVNPKFLGVEIKAPTKTKYYHTDTLDLSTGSIIKKWAGKENESLSIEPSMVVDEAGNAVDLSKTTYDDTNKTQKTLKIKYDYTAPDGTAKTEIKDYTIEIINKVSSITIVDEPKKDYNHSDSIDKTVGTFEVIWQNGSKKTIPLADPRITIENFDTSSQGTKNVNVIFTENGESASTSYPIEVTDNVSKIEIVGTPKQDYNCLDSLDLSGLQLKVTRPSGTETISIDKASITGFNTTSLGEQTITVSYGGKTVTFKVNVKDWLKDIEFTKPTKKNYKKTDTQINLAGSSITEVYASGKKIKNIEVTQSMLSTFDNTKLGEQKITVTYKTFTRDFKVVVSDGLAGINVTKFPIDEYLYGENLNLAGATLEVVTESGETKQIPITKDIITGYETKPASSKFNKAGEYIQTITITYTQEGVTKKTSYPITTKDYFEKIKVQGLETSYNYGEDIKVAGATVSKVSASGIVSDTTDLTKDMISGYDSKKEGNQIITITYQGKETKQTVKVIDNILGISINSNPSKTNYDYASSLNLSGAKLNVIKNSGTKVINITKDMVTGYNPRKSGTQTITVTYAGLKATFAVTVGAKPYVPPVQKPTTPVAEEPVVETPVIEEPVIETPVIQKPIEKPVEKPVQTEVKEETKIDPILVSSVALGGLAILLLLILLLTKKNVEIYLEEEKDIRLIGKAKLNKKDGQKLDITKYTNKYPNETLQVVFSKSISKKLDEKTVRIITGENKEKPVIIKYEKEEFITEINNKKTQTKEKIEK